MERTQTNTKSVTFHEDLGAMVQYLGTHGKWVSVPLADMLTSEWLDTLQNSVFRFVLYGQVREDIDAPHMEAPEQFLTILSDAAGSDAPE